MDVDSTDRPDAAGALKTDGVRESPKDHNSRRAAACLVCRRSKIKCEKGRMPNDERCQRCLQLGVQCVRPDFHVGRRKGVKNKRTGLEKALHQVEQAVRRSGTSIQGIEATKVVSELKVLLGSGSEGSMPPGDTIQVGGRKPNPRRDSRQSDTLLPDASSDAGDSSASDQDGMSVPPQGSTPSQGHAVEESLAVDDAENPLQLLARASDLHVSPKSGNDSLPAEAASHQRARQAKQPDQPSEVEKFFKLSQFSLDVGSDLDPIDLGLMTVEEADALFTFFHHNLAHTRWGLDPVLYTASFTRSRSAFLFTSICAASALFMAAASALSRRLSNHCQALVNRIIRDRYRSVEIVLAFMVNVPWMAPGKHSTDDETCWYVSMATTMALDLSLHKILVSQQSVNGQGMGSMPMQVPRADCIDPKVALSLDGFSEVDPNSEYGRRLLRRRERCWIALFVLERGMCLARGRCYTVPITPILKGCDQWHLSNIADTMDGHLVSMAVLRRDLAQDDLFASIRAVCDGSRDGRTGGGIIATSIQMTVDKFFDEWHAKWGISIGTGPRMSEGFMRSPEPLFADQAAEHRLPPYVQILVTHTRLSIYSSVINHPTAPTEVRHFFHAAGLSSALNVMRAAIQGESQLSSMPNNTAIMISFAACFALRLSGQLPGNSNLAPSVRALIEETAEVLERIGSATKHRDGMSALYGKYLRCIVKKAALSANETAPRPRTGHHQPEPLTQQHQATAPYARHSDANNHNHARGSFSMTDALPPNPAVSGFLEPPIWSEPIQFSSMSDDQVVEALSRVNNEFDPALNMYPWDDAAALDWLNWSNLPDFGT
ncbi:uncharacterized protein QC763_503860 [Podospora pseudopauciseta]|uniref:Zn(2)-C6 fungal-type domain-containing protein n=2 Tax=Podospora TaxID=5144 RepID=A0ABR0H8K9_9PEZI|nr:hypothetical protein QC763_503860 [Podospora pseudopauciseta]KAK4675385.1 hypothetical protein QC764_503860 [Podospora pseudoanserina]